MVSARRTLWEFETWATTERPLFIAMVEERMSQFGSMTAAENDALWPQMKAEVKQRFRPRQRSGTTT
jgi:hypothetical protein